MGPLNILLETAILGSLKNNLNNIYIFYYLQDSTLPSAIKKQYNNSYIWTPPIDFRDIASRY